MIGNLGKGVGILAVGLGGFEKRLQPAQLIAAGKPFKLVVTAAMRKLLIILNSIIKINAPFGGPTDASFKAIDFWHSRLEFPRRERQAKSAPVLFPAATDRRSW